MCVCVWGPPLRNSICEYQRLSISTSNMPLEKIALMPLTSVLEVMTANMKLSLTNRSAPTCLNQKTISTVPDEHTKSSRERERERA